MAFDRSTFAYTTLAQGSNAPKLNTYRSSGDTLITVGGSGYFNDLSDQLEVGDFILVDASDGFEVAAVATNAAGVVTTVSAALA